VGLILFFVDKGTNPETAAVHVHTQLEINQCTAAVSNFRYSRNLCFY